MYIAIQVQSTREKLAIKHIQEALNDSDIANVKLHFFERLVTKLNQNLKTVRENIIPGYIVAEIEGVFCDVIYKVLSQAEYVIKVLHQVEVTEEEFNILQENANKGVVRIKEPKYPKYRRDNRMIDRLEKALAVAGISKKAVERLKAYIAKTKEQHMQYQAYIRNFSIFSSFRVFTGRNYVLDFPAEALTKAKNRLFDIPFGWSEPAQLALRLAVSMGVKLE